MDNKLTGVSAFLWINLIKFILAILVFAFLANTVITQKMTIDAIRDCSGSPSCIESTVSVLLYRNTPCLDGYNR